jgi:hypothetical protein
MAEQAKKKTGLHPCTPEKVIKKVLKKKQQKQLVGKESLIWFYQVLTCNSAIEKTNCVPKVITNNISIN